MRGKLIRLIGATALTSTIVTLGCADYSNSNSSGTGGSTSAGGNSATGGSAAQGTGGTSAGGNSSAATGGTTAAPCTTATPCGGDVTGTWTVKSSCLSVSGTLDMQGLWGLTCPTGNVTGTLQVTGTFTANTDGTFTDNTTTTGTEQLALPAACKYLSGTTTTCDRIGSVMNNGYFDTTTCKDSSDGGCSCTGTLNTSGSMGIATMDAAVGSYTTSGNVLKLGASGIPYNYCVASGALTITPQSSARNGTIAGTISLQKQ